MQTMYEIYYVAGFCDSEWERLGEIESESADVFSQVIQRWPEYPHDLLVLHTQETALSLAAVKKKVQGVNRGSSECLWHI